ncbi:DUF4956 domain-containing protein [Porcipelethomonas sp.]|uniref:DUF4956 domain-containing protein n=1 Tax=Porcipelethomonas sp. TaxID=2981675 RepID=UPI003EFAD1B0
MPKIFESVIGTNITIGTFLICIIAAVAAGFLISILYKATHRKESVSQSYIMSIVMLPGIVSVIILLINDTSKALGLAGAFSLVRFRSVPGDPKDIAYIFFAMAAGVSCGLGYITFAAIFIIILSAVMLVLNAFKYGMPDTSSMTLKITVPENLNYQGLFDSILDENTTSWHLKRVKTVDFGTLFDLVYSIELKNNVDQKKFIDSLRTLNGNLNVTLILYKYDDQIYAK